MSKELLIAGGFDYSDMHDSYRNVSNTPYQRLEVPDKYKSLVTGNTYDYREYSPIPEAKKGWLPLPSHEYPYTLLYKDNRSLWRIKKESNN